MTLLRKFLKTAILNALLAKLISAARNPKNQKKAKKFLKNAKKRR